jgi:hypothetical protein
MRHELSSIEKAILGGAVRDLQRLRRGRPLEGTDRTDNWYRLRQAVDDAKQGYVRLDAGRWLGQELEPSDRMMLSRAYQRLEARGLVERANVTDGPRATHLYITRAGVRMGKEVAAVTK